MAVVRCEKHVLWSKVARTCYGLQLAIEIMFSISTEACVIDVEVVASDVQQCTVNFCGIHE